MLTLLLGSLTLLSWFFVVENAGGFAPLAMIFYVPIYLAVYGILYWRYRTHIKQASKYVLPLFVVLVLATVFLSGPLWKLLQNLNLVGSGV